MQAIDEVGDPFAEGVETEDLGDVFPDEALPTRQPASLFAADPVAQGEEKRLQQADEQRAQDRKIGLLIGIKNLEKLRAFGYDVLLANPDHKALSAGTAHRGMTE
jgi:hypothetical protein